MGTTSDVSRLKSQVASSENPGDLLWQELKDKLGDSLDDDDEAGEKTPTNQSNASKRSSPTGGLKIGVELTATSPRASPDSTASSPSFVYQRLGGAAGSDRRDSATLAQHMKNLAAAKIHSTHLAHHRAARSPRTDNALRSPSPKQGANKRTPTPTLVYQPSSVDELDDLEDGASHAPVRIVFNDQEEVVF